MNNYLYLVYQITRTAFFSRDQSTILGTVWHVLNPLFLSLVLLAVFTFKFHSSTPNYGFYILLGVIHFNYFSNFTSTGAVSLSQRRSLILNTRIPRGIPVIADGLNITITFIIELFVTFLLMLISGLRPGWTVIYYPVIFLAQFMLFLGISLFMASLSVMFKDLSYLWRVFTQILFFCTPIFFTLDDYGSGIANDILRINPISQILIMSRESLLYRETPNFLHLIALFLVSLVTLLIGYVVMKYLEPRMADKI